MYPTHLYMTPAHLQTSMQYNLARDREICGVMYGALYYTDAWSPPTDVWGLPIDVWGPYRDACGPPLDMWCPHMYGGHV